MQSNNLSVSGTKRKSKVDDPVAEIGQIPFALCEIVAKAEAASLPEVARLADSMVDLLLGCGSLKILELPQVAKDEIRAVISRYAVV